MNDHELSDEEAAQISQQIDEIRRFLIALVEDPSPLQVIPTQSTVRHRTIQVGDRKLQLTAHRQSDSEEPWTARLTSWDTLWAVPSDVPSKRATERHPPSEPAAGSPAGGDELVVYGAESADAALDELEHAILDRPMRLASA